MTKEFSEWLQNLKATHKKPKPEEMKAFAIELQWLVKLEGQKEVSSMLNISQTRLSHQLMILKAYNPYIPSMDTEHDTNSTYKG